MTPLGSDGDESAPDTSQAQTLAQPTVNTFDRYRSHDVGWGTVVIRMVPDPSSPNYRAAPWAVWMKVRCERVGRLMDEGFHWSTDNILDEEGSMSHKLQAKWEARGFRHARRWTLADKTPGREAPRWVAVLEVLTPFLEILPSFPLHELSPANICSADAWDPRDKLVYNFNCRTPGRNYNCLYDGRPLQGWWPWPKEEPIEVPGTLAALTAASWASEEDRNIRGPNGCWGDELFSDLPVRPLVRPCPLPRPQLSHDELEAHRQRLNQYRESLVRYQALLDAHDGRCHEAAGNGGGGGGCVIL